MPFPVFGCTCSEGIQGVGTPATFMMLRRLMGRFLMGGDEAFNSDQKIRKAALSGDGGRRRALL